MASISSLTGSSSSSSIYGTRSTNMITGLASGLDTEAMIEGLVQSYETKIQSLGQDKTKLTWEQEAYQSISDLLVEFSREYTSYTSSTNLLSQSFFDNSVITSVLGKYADAISATGKTDSEVSIDEVTQLATSARYVTSGESLSDAIISGESMSITGDTEVDLSQNMNLSTLDGSINFEYGSKSFSIEFDELEYIDAAGDGSGEISAQEFADAVAKKLEDVNITIGDNSYKASELIKVNVSGDEISFEDTSGAGNSVKIKSATTGIKDALGTSFEEAVDDDLSSFTFTSKVYSEEINVGEYISGEEITVTLNGQTETIKIGDVTNNEAFVEDFNASLNRAFGEGNVSVAFDGDGKLTFNAGASDSLSVSSAEGNILGLSEKGLTSYVNESKTLEELGLFEGVTEDERDIIINGVTVGSYDKDTSLETILKDINNNVDAGVSVSYSSFTNKFVFNSDQTGSASRIEIGEGLAAEIFGSTETAGDNYKSGTDAKFTATVNGETHTYTRSSNNVNIDGLSVTFKDTFTPEAGEESVTFKTESDSDKIVDAISKMVEDYNEIMTAVKDAYSTAPLEQSNGNSYEPLLDSDREGLSESEIEALEEKAKTGLLYMDSDLSSLYDSLRSAITPVGTDGVDLRDIGISTSYSEGRTTLVLDETKLREVLSTEPDKVKDVFTKTTDDGSSTDGLMQSILDTTNKYAKETGEPKGILIEKAGSKYSPTTITQNTILDMLSDLDDEIETWQDKLSNQVDYYTRQFTQLEVLMNEMNSQSSQLSSLMGGY